MKQSIKPQLPAEQIAIAKITVDQVSLQPLQELFNTLPPHEVVDDLNELASLLNSILYQSGKSKWSRIYIQDRVYAVHTLRDAFLKIERSLYQKGGHLCQ